MFLLYDEVLLVQQEEYLIYLSDNRCFCCMMSFFALRQNEYLIIYRGMMILLYDEFFGGTAERVFDYLSGK